MDKDQLMRASVNRSYGSPDVINIEHVPVPVIADNDVLIKIHASTVNRTDCGFLRAKPFIVRFFSGLLRPKYPILGCEFAGEISACGSAVTNFNIGDRICGFKDDDHGFGGHAQFTSMPATAMLTKIPDSMSYTDAAPALEGSHYALNYIRAANIKAGDRVLINGATGAIGSAALQIIKHMGSTVTAVCATEHTLLIQQLGADTVIDYKQQDFTQLDEQFDVVFDAVGKSTFGQCKRILTSNGIYISTELGPWAQNPLLALWTARSKSQKVLFPIPVNKKEDADYIAGLMQENKFRPLVDKTYPLEETASAFRYVETGMKTGNVVIDIN